MKRRKRANIRRSVSIAAFAGMFSGICGTAYAVYEVLADWQSYAVVYDSQLAALRSEFPFIVRLGLSFATVGFLSGLAVGAGYAIWLTRRSSPKG